MIAWYPDKVHFRLLQITYSRVIHIPIWVATLDNEIYFERLVDDSNDYHYGDIFLVIMHDNDIRVMFVALPFNAERLYLWSQPKGNSKTANCVLMRIRRVHIKRTYKTEYIKVGQIKRLQHRSAAGRKPLSSVGIDINFNSAKREREREWLRQWSNKQLSVRSSKHQRHLSLDTHIYTSSTRLINTSPPLFPWCSLLFLSRSSTLCHLN